MNDQQASGAVLITGASGFLGGWCVVEALERGYQVRASVRNASRERELREMIESKRGSSAGLSVVEADLSRDDGWEQAVSGCDYVLHVASPFPAAQPKDPDELIVPAREGTLRVLRAGLAAGVRRVVVTSSVAAVRNFAPLPDRPLAEEDWTDPDLPNLSPYARSKTIAERAAWELARGQNATDRLAVVNPSAILGPVLSAHRSTSTELVERLLTGMPGMPRLSFSVVDVRDVAELHLLAMASPEAAGERFLAVGPSLWISEMAKILREQLGPAASKVPRRTFPDALVRLAARFDPALRSFTADLGRHLQYSHEKAETRLGWKPRPVQDTLVDCASSLLAQREPAAAAA
ncbi:MAG TPA: NAD-dependent epimerase/dehydratase family protein [Solirubrobacteraceae bacterium]|nr:NAD-dependent epimerase/dehydratase family protein [Solirubrobacteraceae bacterium]